MRNAPLARHLVCFSRQSPAGASAAPVPVIVPPPEPEPAVTMSVAAFEARLLAAREELRAELEAGFAAERAGLQRAHAEALDAAVVAATTRRDGEEGAALAAQIETATAGLRAALAEELAAALRPLLSEAVAARAVAQLVQTVERVLADPERTALTISGPAARLAAVEAALPARAGLTFTVTHDGDEVRVAANGMRVETRFAAALDALSEQDA